MAVSCVPDPIDKEVASNEEGQEWSAKSRVCPVGDCGEMVSKIEGAMAIAQRNTREIPEYQHKAPFLIIDIPRSVISDNPLNESQ